MDYDKLYPFWKDLSLLEREAIQRACLREKYAKGMRLYRSEENCKGLLSVLSGQLRVYIVSEEGREVTLFRVYGGEVCVLSVSCLMDSIAFDVVIEATEETEVLVLPSAAVNQILQKNPYVALYLYQTAAERFSAVMWTMQQILFKKIDQRVAAFLWEEAVRSKRTCLRLTHDEIARYIGSAREVVTRVLKYLAEHKAIALGRGQIVITDWERLKTFL